MWQINGEDRVDEPRAIEEKHEDIEGASAEDGVAGD